MDMETCPAAWLMLLAQLPSKPSSVRVALWRRMRGAGATPAVNGAWMLPFTGPHEDFFQRSREDIVKRGGTGFVLRVSSLAPESDETIVRLFQVDRSHEYEEFAERCGAFIEEIKRESSAGKYTFAEMEESEQDLKKLERWLVKIQSRDFFPGENRDNSVALLGKCRRALKVFSQAVYKAEGVQEFAEEWGIRGLLRIRNEGAI